MLRRLVLLACSLRGARASEEFYFQVDNYAQVFFNGDLLYQDVNAGIDYGTIVLKSAPSVGDVLAIKGSVAGASSERGGILARLGEIASSSRSRDASSTLWRLSAPALSCGSWCASRSIMAVVTPAADGRRGAKRCCA